MLLSPSAYFQKLFRGALQCASNFFSLQCSAGLYAAFIGLYRLAMVSTRWALSAVQTGFNIQVECSVVKLFDIVRNLLKFRYLFKLSAPSLFFPFTHSSGTTPHPPAATNPYVPAGRGGFPLPLPFHTRDQRLDVAGPSMAPFQPVILWGSTALTWRNL